MDNLDPQKLARLLVKHGEAWSDAKAAADLLENQAKNLHAEIALRCLHEAKGVISKAETMATASDEYKQHIKDMVEARRKANRARVQYDADITFIELMRSKESTERAMINLR